MGADCPLSWRTLGILPVPGGAARQDPQAQLQPCREQLTAPDSGRADRGHCTVFVGEATPGHRLGHTHPSQPPIPRRKTGSRTPSVQFLLIKLQTGHLSTAQSGTFRYKKHELAAWIDHNYHCLGTRASPEMSICDTEGSLTAKNLRTHIILKSGVWVWLEGPLTPG